MSRSGMRGGKSSIRSFIRQQLWSVPCLFLAANPLMADEATKALDREYEFRIAAQSVNAALAELAKQADVQLMFAAGEAGNRPSPGVSGKVTVAQALDQILKDTGLAYEVKGENTVTVKPTSTGPAPVMAADRRTSFRLAQAGSPSQGTTDASQANVGVVELEEIVVTGTNIRGATPTSPVIEIDRTYIERSGYTTVAEVLRSVPQNFNGGLSLESTVGNALGGVPNATAASSPNLRGLGAGSTLTLINGRRVPAASSQNSAADISLIPLDAVERIEVLTDGASTIYGSDAVAGVVNVILRRDFEGAQTGFSFGTSTEGGGTIRRASQLLGTSWGSGSGMLVYEHRDQDFLPADERDFTANAVNPTYLLPDTSTDSVIGSVRQNFSSTISGFIDASYSNRDIETKIGAPLTPPFPLFYGSSSASSEQYAATTGLTAYLPRNWQSNFFVGGGKQELESQSAFLQVADDSVLAQNPDFNYETTTQFVELNGNGDLFSLPTGTVRFALGAGYREEEIEEQGTNLNTADRDITYAFVEAVVPLLGASDQNRFRRLDLTLSARFEDYSDFGSQSIPKVGILYIPVENLVFRASWGEAFKAPNLLQISGSQFLDYNPATFDELSPAGRSPALVASGANPNLEPETADTWTVGFEFSPASVQGLRFASTYFQIDYEDRIQTLGPAASFRDPLNAPFVILNPSPALQQQLIAAAGSNFGDPFGLYDPANVVAYIDRRPQNVTVQEVKGIDGRISYVMNTDLGAFDLSLDGSYLRIDQIFTPVAPEQTITGTIFNPPRFRSRAGAAWTRGEWSVAGFVNYLSSESNTTQPGTPRISSWTTVDGQISYDSDQESGWLSGVRMSFAVQNLLDKDPPFAQFDAQRVGINYDSANTTPLGRFVRAEVRKSW